MERYYQNLIPRSVRMMTISFESKEEAERHGLELCKEWVDKQGN